VVVEGGKIVVLVTTSIVGDVSNISVESTLLLQEISRKIKINNFFIN